ncbi:MAG: DUF5711 family protein [Clostridiales bacterium]|nr:DUF5711 family protein [Clostridiales bacterium]
MANIITKLKKNIRKNKLNKEKANEKNISYEQKLARRRRALIRRGVLTVAVVAAAVAIVLLYLEKRSFNNFQILHSSEQEDVVSTQYAEMNGNILRYSTNSVSLVDTSLNTLWSESCSMENPIADVNGDRAVIGDQDGTTLILLDENGITGNITVSYPIVKVRAAGDGMAAAILDNGDETWINFYSTDGSLIAENQTNIEDPGYPLDVAVADDGLMMVAYQFIEGSDTTSYVAFYNFGDVGQNEDDRIVSGYTYEGVIIPQIAYLGNGRFAAFRDDGVTFYEGTQIPKETETIEAEEEIVSTFYDEDSVGLVYKNTENDENLYVLKVYDTSGNLILQKSFNISYTTIKMSGNSILLYNSSQICVISGHGVQKYAGSMDGTVSNFFKVGWNRYLLVMDTGVSVIKFS